MFKETNRNCKTKELMETEFITHEQALALKELGFDEPCFIYWVYDGVEITYSTSHNKSGWSIIGFKNSQMLKKAGLCTAPTFSQAFRWFREKHNLQHEIYYLDDLIKNGYKVTETSTNTELTEFQYKHNYFELSGYDFEEAELECLKKLIEIVKEKNQ